MYVCINNKSCFLSYRLHQFSLAVVLQENEHLKKFQVTWELHNKHLFESLVFSEPILHSSLPALVAQLKYAQLLHSVCLYSLVT